MHTFVETTPTPNTHTLPILTCYPSLEERVCDSGDGSGQ